MLTPMRVEVEGPGLAERGEWALHHEPLAPVELRAQPLVRFVGPSPVVSIADDIRRLAPRGRLHGAGEAADGLS